MNGSGKLEQIRILMNQLGLDAYIISGSDPHQNEYIPECWQIRKWLSGFTGSAGTIVITNDTAGLWTDSRYFLQAGNQLSGSGISLFRLRVPHTPEHVGWLAGQLPVGAKIGVDDRFFSESSLVYLRKELAKAGKELVTGADLVTPVWSDRPGIPSGGVEDFPVRFAGKPREEKILHVRNRMKESGADYHLISSLDDIAWLLNLRGSDIAFCPFFISHCLIGADGPVSLFIHTGKIDAELQNELAAAGILIQPYDDLSEAVQNLPDGKTILYAPERISAAVTDLIPKGCRRIHDINITTLLKAVKNETELSGLREVMARDGAAWVKTLHWLNRQLLGGEPVSEWTVALKIAEFRSKQEGYRGESFHPISSFGPHGAVIHYSVTPEESLDILPGGIFLLDSGGHYNGGTTDTTRTIATGNPSDQERSDFTRVLKGTLGISMLRFPNGTKGYQLDVLARKSLWDNAMNYGHGTGHGVGHFLSVHEGPQTIGTSASGYQNADLQPGMITTVEPGLYREGRYGMRTENMTLVTRDTENEFGEFFRFETLTLVPVDRRLIDKKLLSADEINWINNYHSAVYTKLAGYLDEEERNWLLNETQPL